jgi:hypothetical protein
VVETRSNDEKVHRTLVAILSRNRNYKSKAGPHHLLARGLDLAPGLSDFGNSQAYPMHNFRRRLLYPAKRPRFALQFVN